jgi:hypothetical protein
LQVQQSRAAPADAAARRMAGGDSPFLFPQGDLAEATAEAVDVALQKGRRAGMTGHCFHEDSGPLKAVKIVDGKRKDCLIEKTITL